MIRLIMDSDSTKGHQASRKTTQDEAIWFFIQVKFATNCNHEEYVAKKAFFLEFFKIYIKNESLETKKGENERNGNWKNIGNH